MYGNVRWGYDDVAVARLWTTACAMAPYDNTCQDLTSSVLYENFDNYDRLDGKTWDVLLTVLTFF